MGTPGKQKRGKHEEDESRVAELESMPPWALAMQTALMTHTTEHVTGLRVEVDQAKAMAMEAQEGFRQLKKQLDELRQSKFDSPSVMRDVRTLEAEFQKLKVAATVGPSHRKAEQPEEQDRRKRTVTFGNFPQDTKSEEIIAFIDNVMKDEKDNLQETFAFGKKRAERGGARFASEACMWKYMTERAGKHQHDYKAGKVYCNVDGPAESSDAERERAVRKVVRVIIESNGGDGQAVKKDIETNYKREIVWWKDQRAAEWKEGRMVLMGAAAGYLEAFEALSK